MRSRRILEKKEVGMTDSDVTAFNPAARLADETVAKIKAVAQSATPADKKAVQDLIARAAKGVKEATIIRLTPALAVDQPRHRLLHRCLARRWAAPARRCGTGGIRLGMSMHLWCR
jgi:hypothetical protein